MPPTTNLNHQRLVHSIEEPHRLQRRYETKTKKVYPSIRRLRSPYHAANTAGTSVQPSDSGNPRHDSAATILRTLEQRIQSLEDALAENDDGSDDEDGKLDETPHQAVLRLKWHIRNHARQLMGRRTKHDPIPHPPSLQALEEFNRSGSGGPTLEDFRLDLMGPISRFSPWNEAATQMFVRSFATLGCSGSDDDIEVEYLFKKYTRNLKIKYAAILEARNGGRDTMQTSNRTSRDIRKIKLFYCRLLACQTIPELNAHCDKLLQLGTEAMSSDESGTEGSSRVYSIQKPRWRSLLTTEWVRDIDARYLDVAPVDFCLWLRRRVDWDRVSTKCIPTRGLPINFYDATWLRDLSAEKRLELRIIDAEYDFRRRPSNESLQT